MSADPIFRLEVCRREIDRCFGDGHAAAGRPSAALFFVLCVCGFLAPVRLPPFHYRRAGSSSVHASQPALPGELRSLEWGCQPPTVERPDQIAPRAQRPVFVAHGLFTFSG